MIYEALLSSPGMSDVVKLNIRLPRKNILLLAKLIEAGLAVKDDNQQSDFMQIISADMFDNIKDLSVDILSKGGLLELNGKIASLQGT